MNRTKREATQRDVNMLAARVAYMTKQCRDMRKAGAAPDNQYLLTIRDTVERTQRVIRRLDARLAREA